VWLSTESEAYDETSVPAIFVDADACPVKPEILKVAERFALDVFLVANTGLRPVRDPHVHVVIVGSGFDEADDWIADHITSTGICVTNDVPLASRCVEKGAVALSPSGRIFDRQSTGLALAARNVGQHHREATQTQTYNAPFSARDRSAFLQALDRLIRQRIPH
jgi:uncharacterized protein YaiI (UPF0178 family)